MSVLRPDHMTMSPLYPWPSPRHYMAMWNRAGPCGVPGHGSLSVPHLLFVGNRLQPPWPSLSSKGQVQTVANQGREGDAETREEQSRNDSAALGQGPSSTLRDTHNNVFELFTELKLPINGICQHSSFQRRPPEARLKEPEQLIKRPD